MPVRPAKEWLELLRKKQVIEVDVQGKIIPINKNIISKIEGSSLEVLLSGRHSVTLRNDRIAIDRNPIIFSLLLSFLEN